MWIKITKYILIFMWLAIFFNLRKEYNNLWYVLKDSPVINSSSIYWRRTWGKNLTQNQTPTQIKVKICPPSPYWRRQREETKAYCDGLTIELLYNAIFWLTILGSLIWLRKWMIIRNNKKSKK